VNRSLNQGCSPFGQSVSLREREHSLRVEDYQAQLDKTAERAIDCLLTDPEPTAHLRRARQASLTSRVFLVKEEQDFERPAVVFELVDQRQRITKGTPGMRPKQRRYVISGDRLSSFSDCMPKVRLDGWVQCLQGGRFEHLGGSPRI
jgi:hypothetical protein